MPKFITMNRTRRLLLRLTPAGQAGLVQGLVPECSSVPPLSAASERLMSNLAASTSSSGSAFAVVSASSLPWNWNFLTFAVLPVLALGASAATGPEVLADEAADVKSSGSNLIPLATRQRLFFKYEKRVSACTAGTCCAVQHCAELPMLVHACTCLDGTVSLGCRMVMCCRFASAVRWKRSSHTSARMIRMA